MNIWRTVIALGIICLSALPLQAQNCIFVSTAGNDATGNGTFGAPYKTIARAKQQVQVVKQTATGPIGVYLRAGTYYLDSALNFGVADGGSAASPITYSSYRGEKVIISGGIKVTSAWTSTTLNGITVQTTNIGANKNVDQLFLNGTRQILARYPNYSAGQMLQGNTSFSNVFSKVNSCASPTDGPGYIRGLNSNMWGGEDYIITGKSSGSNQPPWQWVNDNNRGGAYNTSYMMTENISELLDTAGEWYYKKSTGDLYFYPPSGTNMSTAIIEMATLEQLIKVVGTASTKVTYLTFNGLTFTQTHRTLFTGTFEGLLRGDWAIVREGAVFIRDAENITIKHCIFDQVGGNGIFMNAYNRNHVIYNNQFTDAGATCVLTVGLQSAVRSPSTWQNQINPIADNTPGPLTSDYPESIVIENNLMKNLGVFEKQTAGVCISMSHKVTVRHNRITISPRSAINVNDGTWGGHEIAYNDADSCVRETSDHGPFNSWGRDRYWGTNTTNTTTAKLDAIDITKIHNNRFTSINLDGYPAIDLDDGASYYWVYNNLCLQNGIKFREGFCRKGYNNIIVVGRQACHAWYSSCFDSIYHNIIIPSPLFTTNGNANAYDVQAMTLSSGNQCYIDYNLFWNNGGGVDYSPTKNAGMDAHSQVANPNFVNASAGNYTVAAGSPALTLGFVNFPMDSFGRMNVKVDTLGSECATGVAAESARPAPVQQGIFLHGGRVEVCYFLAMQERVEIDLLSMAGRKLASIKHGIEQAGMHTVTWAQERQTTPAVFLLRVKFGDRTMVKKIISIN
ncbi:MAG: right-handed parallel beta-helix repeat-containing protein [Chitinispirillaceae bacterium]